MSYSIPLPTKLEIAYLHGRCMNQRTIAFTTETSKLSVNRIINIIGKREEHEIKYDYKKQLKYHYVLHKVIANPYLTNNQISKMSQNFDFKMCTTDVGRIIGDLNIKNKIQKPKEKLTQVQKENRVTFCNNLLKSENYLFPITFSDESKLCLKMFDIEF